VNRMNIKKGRLLAVDDNADSATLIARVAAKCGYDARSTTDSSSLARILKEWQPEVLTLDLCMPDEDGINVLSVLTDSGFSGQLLIISGQDEWFRKTASRLASARGLNVADDLSKPVDLKVLRELLTRLAESNGEPRSAIS
jgi:two-component system, chemotaxis family, chemotaxis protein CheY